MKSTMRFISTITLVCLSMAAYAFDDFDQKVANIDVLRDKNVQKELSITEAQRKTMNVYADQYSKAGQDKIAEYQKAKKPVDQAYVNYATGLYTTLRTNVLKTLTAPQIKRLREITLQAVGPRSLMDKTVALKVGMTEDEYKRFRTAIAEGDNKIAKIKADVGKKIQEKYKGQKQPTSQKEADALRAKFQQDLSAEMKKHKAEMDAIIAASEKKTAAIVKDKHRAALTVLMGKPFNPVKPASSTSKPTPKLPAGKPSGKKGG